MSTELQLKSQFDKPETVDKFKKFYLAMNRGVDEQTAAQQYELEKFNFLNEIHTKGYNDCTQISIMGVFLDVMSAGLTFNKQMNHVYVMTRSTKLANGTYEKRLVFQVQADGKEFLAVKAGSIKRMSKPVIVYEGDKWGIKTNDQGDIVIVYESNPNHGTKIIAGFIYIVYPDGSREPFYMEESDINRLAWYSAKQNGSRGANVLYTSMNGQIDTGFFKAKLMTHALNHIGKAPIAKANEVDENFVEERPSVVVAEHDPEVGATIITGENNINNEQSDDLAF